MIGQYFGHDHDAIERVIHKIEKVVEGTTSAHQWVNPNDPTRLSDKTRTLVIALAREQLDPSNALHLSDLARAEFAIGLSVMRLARAYAIRIGALLSGEDNENQFFDHLKTDLSNLDQVKQTHGQAL